MDLSNLAVAIASAPAAYPHDPPFDPPVAYPELPYTTATDESNTVYPAVRQCLRLLGMDAANYGTPEWNPLGEVISPGTRVLVKPNFVLDCNRGGGSIDAVITHPSVLRAIADYAMIALKGAGELIIGDAPQMNCQWSNLLTVNGIGALSHHLNRACNALGVNFALMDFRQEETRYSFGIVWRRKRLSPPEDRTVVVDLGTESLMEQIDTSLLYGADYDRRQTVRAHCGHRHEYLVAAQALAADVVISVPKLKVHSKVGTTLNLKNLVGINTDKNHLAHYRVGPRAKGGDEFSDPRWDDVLDRRLSDFLLGRYWRVGKYPFVVWRGVRKLMRTVLPRKAASFVFGNWCGNDTAWRMALDLNRIVLTASTNAVVHGSPQRTYFSFVDGIMGGHGNGPLSPEAYPSGVILAGGNPLAVDWVATRLMGLDPDRIPMYANAIPQMREWVAFDPADIPIRSTNGEWENLIHDSEPTLHFLPAPGWRGRVELYARRDTHQQRGIGPPTSVEASPREP